MSRNISLTVAPLQFFCLAALLGLSLGLSPSWVLAQTGWESSLGLPESTESQVAPPADGGETGGGEVTMNPIEMIQAGDLDNIKKYIEDGTIPITATDPDGRNLAHYSVKYKQPEILSYLIGKGVDINARDKMDMPPLLLAAAENSFGCARVLLEAGVSPNVTGFNGNTDGAVDTTPLIFASEMGAYETAELLIQKGADINYVNKKGRTALFWANKAGQTKVAELLKGHGAVADPAGNGNDPSGYSGPPGSSSGGSTGGTTGGGTSGGTTGGTTGGGTTGGGTTGGTTGGGTTGDSTPVDPVNLINSGDLASLMKYIEAGSLSVAPPNGFNMAYYAVKAKQPEILSYLIKKGADIKSRTKEDLHLLHVAAVENSFMCAEILIDSGESPNVTGFNNGPDGVVETTPLILASELGALETIEVLVRKGADINYINKKGRTALFWAKKAGQTKVAKLLESHGAIADPAGNGNDPSGYCGPPGNSTGGSTGSTGGSTGTSGGSTSGGGVQPPVPPTPPGPVDNPAMKAQMEMAIRRIKQLQGVLPGSQVLNAMQGAAGTHLNLRKVAMLLRARYRAAGKDK